MIVDMVEDSYDLVVEKLPRATRGGLVGGVLRSATASARRVAARYVLRRVGTIAGVVALLERSREKRPTVWLELGDLVRGPPVIPTARRAPVGRTSRTSDRRRGRAGTTTSTTALDALQAAAALAQLPACWRPTSTPGARRRPCWRPTGGASA
jgi:hypothetical protein